MTFVTFRAELNANGRENKQDNQEQETEHYGQIYQDYGFKDNGLKGERVSGTLGVYPLPSAG